VLAEAGLLVGEAHTAGPNDPVLAVRRPRGANLAVISVSGLSTGTEAQQPRLEWLQGALLPDHGSLQDGPDERVLEGLVDDQPIPAGTLVCIDTTGRGGWGDSPEHEPELVVADVLQRKLSHVEARQAYRPIVRRAPDCETVLV